MRDKTKKKFRTRYKDFREGFVHGMGWSFGVSVGFVLVSTLLVILFNTLGTLPVIGDGVASIVAATQDSLSTRSVIAPK